MTDRFSGCLIVVNDLERLSLWSLISSVPGTRERKWVRISCDFKVAIEPSLWIRVKLLVIYQMLDNLWVLLAKIYSYLSISITLLKGRTIRLFKSEMTVLVSQKTSSIKSQVRFYQVRISRNKSLNSGVGLEFIMIKILQSCTGQTWYSV